MPVMTVQELAQARREQAPEIEIVGALAQTVHEGWRSTL